MHGNIIIIIGNFFDLVVYRLTVACVVSKSMNHPVPCKKDDLCLLQKKYDCDSSRGDPKRLIRCSDPKVTLNSLFTTKYETRMTSRVLNQDPKT